MEKIQESKVVVLAESLYYTQIRPDLSSLEKVQEAVKIEEAIYLIAQREECSPYYSYHNLINHYFKEDADKVRQTFSKIYTEAIEDFDIPSDLDLLGYIVYHAALSFLFMKDKRNERSFEGTIQQVFAEHFKEILKSHPDQRDQIIETSKSLFGRNIL